MRDVPPGGNESLPLTLEQRLNTAGRRFEAACKAGLAPPIEGFLGETAGAERAALLRELVRLDAAHRRAGGQAVSPADYLRRFPELDAAWLDREIGTATLAHAAPAPGLAETVSHVGPAPAPPSAGPALLVPGYEVLGELGRGGMGVVYLARNVLMDRREVLKVVNKALLDKPGVMERFLREIRSAAMLRHNNVVQAYSAVQAGELLSLRWSTSRGRTSTGWCSAGAAAGALRLPLRLPGGDGVAARPRAGDGPPRRQAAEPDAVPQKKKHIVKVLDFGLAKARREGEAVTDLTGFGAVMGTPAYMAPEQAQDAASADVRADIYSLGCTLYFLLTGAPPFTGKSVFAILQAHVSAEPTPLTRRCAAASPELAAVVARMMAKGPASLPEADRGGAGTGAVHQGGVGCEGGADGPRGEGRPAGGAARFAFGVESSHGPPGVDGRAGGAGGLGSRRTEAVVPPSPRPAAPAPVEPARGVPLRACFRLCWSSPALSPWRRRAWS